MKWIFWVLAIALALIGLDFVLGDNQSKQVLSNDSVACSIYNDGIQDLFAFRFRASIEKFDRALEMDPTFAEAGIALAAAYRQAGRQPEFYASLAVADSLTELITDPDRRMLAQLRISRNSETTSYAFRDSLIKRLIKEKPENIFVLEALAGEAAGATNTDKVEKIWRRILEVDPSYAASYNQLGYLELARGNYELAIEHMQKYAFLAPGMANPHDSLGDVYKVMGRYEEAEMEYRLALEVQPDFFPSLINLGRIFLARGQLKVGMGILEKIRSEVVDTKYEQEIDGEILITYLNADLHVELAAANANFISKYPKAPQTGFYRAIHLAHGGHLDQSRVVMDSLLTAWRTGEDYKGSPRARLRTENLSLLYEGLLADLSASPARRLEKWQKAVSFIEDKIAFQDQWYQRLQLANALFDFNRPDAALAALEPMLQVNPNLINCLMLAVECSLSLERPEMARKFMDQLQFSLARADAHLPAKQKAPELEALVIDLEGRS